jgi:DMSO reductase anchor subunit
MTLYLFCVVLGVVAAQATISENEAKIFRKKFFAVVGFLILITCAFITFFESWQLLWLEASGDGRAWSYRASWNAQFSGYETSLRALLFCAGAVARFACRQLPHCNVRCIA